MTELDLEEAKLRYTFSDAPGLQRKRWGRGFTYLDQNGRTIKDTKRRQWIEKLAIPPAWEDVWISPYKNGHILATGRDSEGRKQYIYHSGWHALRKETKFSELVAFSKLLPSIRETTDSHLRKRKLSRKKALALVVRLLEKTMIRVGNLEYTRNYDSYGLTTLEDDHVEINGSKLVFEFTGKSGQEHEIALNDSRLARAVQACQDILGQRLFQYYDDEGERRSISSSDVNDYLYRMTGEAITAKVFRTWGASVLALHYLTHLPDEVSSAKPEKQIQACVKAVAGVLGNTVAICRQYYIHPAVFKAHREGKLLTRFEAQSRPESQYALTREEAALVDLIQNF